jgi:hypothetical protein
MYSNVRYSCVVADVEDATSAWVAWFNQRRFMHRFGRRPPAEVEAE